MMVLNFECKKCHQTIVQLITDVKNEDDLKCSNCGSSDITYTTVIK